MGFFFGFIAFIVVLTKADNIRYEREVDRYGNVEYGSKLSVVAQEIREKDMLSNGGWNCPKCKKINPKYLTMCTCGTKKGEKYPTALGIKQEKKVVTDDNDSELKKLEVLKKYKELLDMGAVSEEEYNNKKQELMEGNLLYKTEREERLEENDINKWICLNCNSKNEETRKSCTYCGAIKQVNKYPTKINKEEKIKKIALMDWTCGKCGVINKCYIGRCVCGSSKPHVDEM